MTPQPALEPQAVTRKATGPTTQAGKDRSKMNAVRHGLSGKTVLMPWEDRAAYAAHCAAFRNDLAPVGEIETRLAQGVADDEWRLSRARAVDANMFALGQFDDSPETSRIDTGDAEMDAALNSARAFRDHSQAFVNLSLYEQRINRSLQKNLDSLRALQKERRAREVAGAAAHKGDAAAQVPPPQRLVTETARKIPGREFVYSTALAAASTTPFQPSGAPPAAPVFHTEYAIA